MADESDAATGYLTDDQGITYLLDGDTGTAKVNSFDDSTSEVTIPSTVSNASTTYDVTEIGILAFGSANITKVTIGNKVTTINSNAFSNCSKLKAVTLEESSKLTSIEEYAFEGCYKLESVNLDKATELESIGDCAFYLCKLLNSLCSSAGHTDLELNSKLETIGGSAFADCYGLKSITIPDSVTTVGIGVFGNNTSLETVDIRNKIVGSGMFSGCTSIKSVTFSDTLTSGGTYDFDGITFHETDGTSVYVYTEYFSRRK